MHGCSRLRLSVPGKQGGWTGPAGAKLAVVFRALRVLFVCVCCFRCIKCCAGVTDEEPKHVWGMCSCFHFSSRSALKAVGGSFVFSFAPLVVQVRGNPSEPASPRHSHAFAFWFFPAPLLTRVCCARLLTPLGACSFHIPLCFLFFKRQI